MKKILFVLGLLFIGTGVHADWTYSTRSTSDMTITLSTVTSRVRTLIDDPYTTYGTVRYSSATIHGFINDAQQRLLITTGLDEAYAYQSLVAGTTEYSLPKDSVYLERITLDILDGKGEKVIPQKTVWKLDDENSAWTIKTSTPTAYYIRNRNIGMYPFPEYSGAVLKVWYMKAPARMTSESDAIFDGLSTLEPYWELLAIYAAAKIAALENNTAAYTQYVNEWQGGLKDIGAFLKYNPNYTPTNVMDDK